MKHKIKKVTPTERAFMRAYAAALKRNFVLLTGAIQLMSPQSLAVTCPVQAASLTYDLQIMQALFDGELSALALKHQMRPKKGVNVPTPDQLVRIMQLSFFKLLEKKAEPHKPVDKGWFSGHPLDWAVVLKRVEAAASPEKAVIGSVLAAIADLFLGKQVPKHWKNKASGPEKDDQSLEDYHNEEDDPWHD